MRCKIFDVRGIDFMVPFPTSNSFEYILVDVRYVSRWVEVIPAKTNDAWTLYNFLRKILLLDLAHQESSLSGEVAHSWIIVLQSKYDISHKTSIPYHAETQDQVEVSNRELKRILTVGISQKDWIFKLDDAL